MVRACHRAGMAEQHEVKIRPATVADVDEVVRLAEVMFGAVGYDVSDPSWLTSARAVLSARLGDDAAAFVVDHPAGDGTLIASGAGTILQRLPGPANPTARVGYIQWIATEPEWRGRGLARAVMLELLQWYRENDVLSVELHSSAAGERVYRALGFDEGPHAGLRLRLQD